jgi:ElaB/YqjD/DUF883 family membrane-anchored ribosome-binding protein
MNTSSGSTKSPTAAVSETARGAVESMRNAAGDIRERSQDAISQAGAAATEMADSASEQVTTFASELTKMTRNNPFGTLAGAAIVGVLVGLLLRGRPNSE